MDLILFCRKCHSDPYRNRYKNKNFVLCCLEHDLEIIRDWFRANKLTLNVNKTVFMLFHPKGKKMSEQLKFEDKIITNSHETKFLGIWLNDNLSWESLTRQLTLKIKRNMILLKRSRNFLRKNALLPIYYGHIHSHLKYGILLWGSMINQSQLKWLQKLQDNAIHLLDHFKDVESIYLDYKIPSLGKLIRIEQQKFAYRLIKDLLPVNLSNLVKTDHKGINLCKTHNYSTRFKAEINLPATKSSLYHSSFLHQSIKMFSTLPTEIKNKTSLKVFARAIKHLA